MKRFDQQSIENRLLTRLRVNLDWAMVSENATLRVVSAEYSESLAELARYMEYLFNELKWDNAVNLSSQVHLGSLLGRKPARRKSATGFVIVAATDAEGIDRLSNLGSSFFNLDDLSNYDDIEKNTSLLGTYTKTLTPWFYSEPFYVPKGSIFTASTGISFISTETVSSRILQEPYSVILRNESKLKAFKQKGGWEGIKYLKVPVIQGTLRTVDLGKVVSSKFETFKIASAKVENASNSISEGYLKFIVTMSNGDQEEWVKVNSVLLADSYDKVFECYVNDEGTETLFRVGNGITGALLPEGATLSIQYLESAGASGNIETKYAITSMTFPANVQMIDPRTNKVSRFLSCTNISNISGGQDAEDDLTYRENAPLAYMDSYTVGNTKKYTEYTKKNSPVRLSKLRIFKDTSTKTVFTVSDGSSINDLKESFDMILPTTKITALDLNNDVIEDYEDGFIKPLVKSMANIKNPSETIEYAEPVFIDIGFAVEAANSDSSLSAKDLEDAIKAAITLKCGIENVDFAATTQLSEVIKTVKSISGVDKLTIEMEAKAEVKYDDVELVETAEGTELVIFPFEFNNLYNSDTLNAGFKNYKTNQRYPLRVDLAFTNLSTTENNRTFFLKDNRLNSSHTNLDLQTLKKYKGSNEMTESDHYTFNNTEYRLYSETEDDFDKKDIRVAQFKYISGAITKAYLATLESFSISPSELRPYISDSSGNAKLFDASKVPANLTVALNSGSTTYCYKKNTEYIDKVDIMFDENYTSKTQGAQGFVAIPLSYFGFNNKIASLEDEERVYQVKNLIKSYISLKVTAVPLTTNFEAGDDTLMSVRDSSDIRVNIIQ